MKNLNLNIKRIIQEELGYLLPIPKTKKDILFLVLSTLLILVYFTQKKPTTITTAPFVILGFFITNYLIFKNPKLSIKFKPIQLIWVTIWLVFAVANLLGYYFYTYKSQAPFETLDFNKTLLITLVKSAISIFIYLLTSITIGNKLLSILKLKHTDKSGYLYNLIFSLGIGLSVIGYVLFLLAEYNQFNTINLLIIIIITTVFSIPNLFKWSKLIKKTIYKEYIYNNVSLSNAILYLLIYFYIVLIIIITQKSFVSGPDALRSYLVIPKSIAENGYLPILNTITTFPYLGSIIFAPAFKFGGISMITSTMFTISSFFILGFYLLLKQITKNKKLIKITLLSLIFYPGLINIYFQQYKIDILLLYFASLVFLSFYYYLKTKESKNLYLLSFFIAISLMIKLTAFYFGLPIMAYVAINTLIENLSFRKKVKKILLITILFVIPIIPWFVFNKTDITTRNTNITECSYNLAKMEEKGHYHFSRDVKSYMKLPYQYLTGKNTFKINTLDLTMSSLSMNDIPISIFILLLLGLFINFNKNKKLNKEKLILSLITIVGMVLFLVTKPRYLWYNIPIFFLFLTIAIPSLIERTSVFIKKYTIYLIYFFILTNILTSLIIYNITFYIPHNVTNTKIAETSEDYPIINKVYFLNYQLNQKMNEVDDNKYKTILISSKASYQNLYYFIDNVLNRTYFYPFMTKEINEESFLEINEKINPEFLLLLKPVEEDKTNCLATEYETIQAIFEKHGDKVYESENQILYQIKK